ncbi:MAG: hypothetical protein DMF82_11240 [Acidobacteria bacterium]|nr:MAG: hypothetical protein DMF82_11240 [Acidobacteriota bacterium]
MSEHGRDERLERAIDAALRQMVGGDGPADMRGRVLARLDEPPRRAPLRVVALAAAAVILIALAVVVGRQTARHPQAAPANSPSAPVIPHSPAPVVRPRPLSPSPVPAEVETAGGQIEPIEVAPLTVAPMETPRWAIAPLRIQPMEIEPLADSQPEQP